MKLYEYQAKARFAIYHIPVPEAKLAETPTDAYEIAKSFDQRVVLKAQELSGHRHRSEGIRFAATPEQARMQARQLFEARIDGFAVKNILIETEVKVKRSLYLAIANDRSVGGINLIASVEGDVDITNLARVNPDVIIREYIDPFIGLRTYQLTHILGTLNLPRVLWEPFRQIAMRLYQCYVESDATLIELNPLAITQDDELIALDGKFSIDDNALFRHPGLMGLRDLTLEYDAERQARIAGLTYVKLDGQIGCVVNGAGLSMTMMDIICLYGDDEIYPANFLDIGGGAKAERIKAALGIISEDTDVAAVLVCIFGGITRCDEVARGIIEAYEAFSLQTPVIIRLQGTHAETARKMLQAADIPHLIEAHSLVDAARKAVSAARSIPA